MCRQHNGGGAQIQTQTQFRAERNLCPKIASKAKAALSLKALADKRSEEQEENRSGPNP